MKPIHTKLARSVWLFDVRDLNPRGKDFVGDLVEWIRDSYDFAVAPDPDHPVPTPPPPGTAPDPQTAPAQQAPGGLLFQRGRFTTREDETIEVGSLTVYNDGLVIDTASSTNDGDQFAEALLGAVARAFDLAYGPETVRRKLYLSELIVRLEASLESLNPALASFAQALPTTFAGGRSLPFGVAGIAFWSEPNDAGLHRMVRIERQVGRDFSEQRFYSQAPMQTHGHLTLLEEFERVLLAQR